MIQVKQKYLLYGIIVLTVIGVVLINAYVEKRTEESVNTAEKEEKPEAQITDTQTEVNASPEEHTEASPQNPKLLSWQKESGIRISGISSSTIFLDNQYWMYYTRDGIELAKSFDGLNFAYVKKVIDAKDVKGVDMVTNPAVFETNDGKYRMIYEGCRWAEDEKGGRYQIDRKLYSAVSNDGVMWTVEEGTRFQDVGDGKPGELFASVPDVIRLSDGRLRMYYTRGATSAAALSNDEGLSWTKETNLKLRKVAIDPDIVWFDEGSYKLFFTTFADEFGIGDQWVTSASSTDGVNFVLDETKLIEPSTSGGLITDPDVIKIDGSYRMYYGEFKKGEQEPNIMSAFNSG